VGLLLLLAALAAFHLAALHRGHAWNGDFALFLMHAQNLVAGQPYEQTPYVLNGVSGNPSPHAYPPGFPVLLAPIVAVFGSDLLPMKAFVIGCFVLALGVVATLFRKDLPPSFLLATIALLGFSPYFTTFLQESVLSDVPFLLFLSLCLLAHSAGQRRPTRRQRLFAALGTGGLLYFAVLIRPLGLILLPSLLLYDLARHRRPTLATLVTIGAFAGAYGLQTVLAAQSGEAPAAGTGYYADLVETSILDRLSRLGGTVVESGMEYANMLGKFLWDLGFLAGGGAASLWDSVGTVLRRATVLLVVSGWALHSWRRLTLFDVFTPLYVLALLPWNFYAARYLIPVLPFCVFYGAYALAPLRHHRWGRAALVGIAVLITGVYGGRLAGLSDTAGPEGAYAPEAQALYQYLRTSTPEDALIVFGKPRFVALETGRRSMMWYADGTLSEHLQFFVEKEVDYAVDGPPSAETWYQGRRPVVELLAAAYPSHFEPVHRSERYVVYRFRPPEESPAPRE
jgi:hypothetical protein